LVVHTVVTETENDDRTNDDEQHIVVALLFIIVFIIVVLGTGGLLLSVLVIGATAAAERVAYAENNDGGNTHGSERGTGQVIAARFTVIQTGHRNHATELDILAITAARVATTETATGRLRSWSWSRIISLDK